MAGVAVSANLTHKSQKKMRSQSVLLANPVLSPSKRNSPFSSSFTEHDGAGGKLFIEEDGAESDSCTDDEEEVRAAPVHIAPTPRFAHG